MDLLFYEGSRDAAATPADTSARGSTPIPTTVPVTTEPRFLKQWGKKGSLPGEFNFPIGLAFTSTDEVLVSDFYNRRIQRFDLEGQYKGEIALVQTAGPIAVDASDRIYVSHFGTMQPDKVLRAHKIALYDRNGTVISEWGQSGTGDGEFDYPGGIAIGPNGRVYVADQTNHRVQMFTTMGSYPAKK